MKYLKLFEGFFTNTVSVGDKPVNEWEYFLIEDFDIKLENLIKVYFGKEIDIRSSSVKDNTIDFDLYHGYPIQSDRLIRCYISFEGQFFNLRINNYIGYISEIDNNIVSKTVNICEYLENKIKSLSENTEMMGSFYELSLDNFKKLIIELYPENALNELELIDNTKKYNI